MRYEDENIWLTQKMMAVLYDVSLPTVNEHVKKIYADSELEESATIRKFRIVQDEGSRKVSREASDYLATERPVSSMTVGMRRIEAVHFLMASSLSAMIVKSPVSLLPSRSSFPFLSLAPCDLTAFSI